MVGVCLIGVAGAAVFVFVYCMCVFVCACATVHPEQGLYVYKCVGERVMRGEETSS